MIKKNSTHGMTMRYPATRWQDALPTGSGVVGALVYGNIQHDTIVLNHDSLYYPKPGVVSLDVSDKLPLMRDMIKRGQCREAAQMMRTVYQERLKTAGGSPEGTLDPYQPCCSVFLKTGTDGPFRNYRRGVDFATGRAWVNYTDNTATFTRETFVSRATDTVLLRIRSNQPGTVSCRLSLGRTISEQLNERDICHSSGRNTELKTSQELCLKTKCLMFHGNYAKKLPFGAVGKLSTIGGKVTAAEDFLVVENADEVVLQVKLFCKEDPEIAVSRLRTAFRAATMSFEDAFSEHARLHGELFNRVQLALGKNESELEKDEKENLTKPQPSTHLNHPTMPLLSSNEELLMAAFDGRVPDSLIQTMFDFGRYLLISSSREGGWPANLQGIWNGDYAPAWNCDIHTDENVQMNYWPALPGGLPETLLPLFDYFESFLDDFRENARNNFGCRGIMVPLALTTSGKVTPLGYANWTAGAGWIGQHFFDYYLFTGDLDFLRDRAVPWLREIALFYEDFLIEGENGKLTYIPSLSPENRPGNGNSLVTIDATMDIAVCREVLTHLCDACAMLGIEAESIPRWRSMADRLPDYVVNEDGGLAEWIHPDYNDNYHHRHQSHLYPVFPGLEITEASNPEIFEAGRVAVEKRLVVGLTSQTGWSMSHMANSYARLGQGNRALECLELLTRGSTGPNLFTYHNDWRQMGLTCGGGAMPPFQIDANFGITAAILEMLVFSQPGFIKLLPALPEKWSCGQVTGIRCRGGITVSIEWDLDQKGLFVSLVSDHDQDTRLVFPAWTGNEPRVISLKKAETWVL